MDSETIQNPKSKIQNEACHCPEGRYEDASGAKITATIGAHDCGYIERRNALIFEAENIAGKPDLPGWSARFMKAMNALAKSKGVVKIVLVSVFVLVGDGI